MDKHIKEALLQLDKRVIELIDDLGGDRQTFLDNIGAPLMYVALEAFADKGKSLSGCVEKDFEEYSQGRELAVQSLQGHKDVAFFLSCVAFCNTSLIQDKTDRESAIRAICDAHEFFGMAYHAAKFPMSMHSDMESIQRKIAATVLSSQGRKAVERKLASDPRQREKAFIRECWQDWTDGNRHYDSKAAFARDMLEKCEHLKSTKRIEDWCREWGKQSTTQPVA